MSDQRLVKVELDEKTLVRRNADVEHERAVAIFDLLEDNTFAPVGDFEGPYCLKLALEEGRLMFQIYDAEETRRLGTIGLTVSAFRRIVKDYFTVCESYFQAIKTASPSQIEAIDMGRRGLHNDGAELLRERLKGKIEIDETTARRLFTLLCVLHIKG
jgi:uncharacterized protein (UPF0262 family)